MEEEDWEELEIWSTELLRFVSSDTFLSLAEMVQFRWWSESWQRNFGV